MNPQEFDILRSLLKKHSGIHLQEDKRYLFETRLQTVLAQSGHQNLSELVQYLIVYPRNDALIQSIVEAMTTNESMFFRDTRPFEALRKRLLPELLERKGDHALSIWCAACSAGQEAYSLAMLMEELHAPSYSILGTDIDSHIIHKAEEGSYNQFEVQRGLPAPYLMKYFEQHSPHEWRVVDRLHEYITFKVHNLLYTDALHEQFDMILCRYVLIYFDDDTKRRVLHDIAKRMPSGGYLLLGSAETLLPDIEEFESHPEERSVYVRV